MTPWEEIVARQKAIVKQAWELVAVSRNLRWKLVLKREVAKRTAKQSLMNSTRSSMDT